MIAHFVIGSNSKVRIVGSPLVAMRRELGAKVIVFAKVLYEM